MESHRAEHSDPGRRRPSRGSLYPGTLLSAYTTSFRRSTLSTRLPGTIAFSDWGRFPHQRRKCDQPMQHRHPIGSRTGGSLTTGGSSGGGYTGAIAAANGGAGIVVAVFLPLREIILPNFADTTSKVLPSNFLSGMWKFSTPSGRAPWCRRITSATAVTMN